MNQQNETLPPLPLGWIKKIFERYKIVYGPALTGALIGNTDDDLKLVSQGWAEELRNFGPTPLAIKHALDNLPPDRPPNLLQFKELCKQGLKYIPAPIALDHKLTPEQIENNRKRTKELIAKLAKEKAFQADKYAMKPLNNLHSP